MPSKRLKPRPLQVELTWPRNSEYQLVSDGSYIEAIGESSPVRLDEEEVYIDWLRTFAAISNAEEALEWISLYGFPQVDMKFNRISTESLLQAAAGVGWLMLLNDTANRSLEGHSNSKWDLDSWSIETQHTDKIRISFQPDQAICARRLKHFAGIRFGVYSKREFDLAPSEFHLPVWERDSDFCRAMAAKDQVRKALDFLLSTIQPSCDWVYREGRWELESRLLVRSLWDGINVGLLNYVTSKTLLRNCEDPRCSRYFSGRRNQRFCPEHKDSGRMYLKRNKRNGG